MLSPFYTTHQKESLMTQEQAFDNTNISLRPLSKTDIDTYKQLLSLVYSHGVRLSYTKELISSILKHFPEDIQASELLQLTDEYQLVEHLCDEAAETFTYILDTLSEGISISPLGEAVLQGHEETRQEVWENINHLWATTSRLLPPKLHSVVVEEMLSKIDNSGMALQYYEALSDNITSLPPHVLQSLASLEEQALQYFPLSTQ
jgi:hypothetical protein